VHTRLPLHTLPQVPQFESSASVLTHAPEQRLNPVAHTVPQVLAAQVAVPFVTLGQAVPQAPQLFRSVLGSTQAAPQRMKGAVHWKPQLVAQVGVPLGGALQIVPHFPQFEVSLPRSTQEPLQSVLSPQSVAHWPAIHTLPEPQLVEQLPQCSALARISTHAPEQFW
jgi:hypothetical protein